MNIDSLLPATEPMGTSPSPTSETKTSTATTRKRDNSPDMAHSGLPKRPRTDPGTYEEDDVHSEAPQDDEFEGSPPSAKYSTPTPITRPTRSIRHRSASNALPAAGLD
ncbi:hypothetical protein P152DRAFT_481329 [Eremomyces bilateralis CBS 781.70]|uniref:Uncharacterized protein n=1 Tax=Eremomyces bilateralis CBS 781.70 TaxID=1392243 RepID=A0A6G1G553_9PEZI|nr:uncharacterized protein P152DRAFT_481329 [Eremomyces bilateralis CBS 781.70]KAF1813207.1 hypothetical protein P152DRAFT_481329 [Eremomyces bilateralis CBS 781.70]